MGRVLAVLILLLFAAAPALATDVNDRMWMAASEGDLEGVKAALQDGADVDFVTRNKTRSSALGVAAMNGHAGVIALLLGRGANVNIVNGLGDTPLITAVSSIFSSAMDKVHIVDLLLANGADVRRTDSDGRTALHKERAAVT